MRRDMAGLAVPGTLVRQAFRTRAVEDGRGPWLRGLAAVFSLAAGVVHLAQTRIHLPPVEPWTFSAFFIVVGLMQLGAAVLLVAPRPRPWFWLGILGSAAVIGTWLVSRSLGLPFGAEPGQAEQVGMADAAASLLEGMTIVALALWLVSGDERRRRGAYLAGIAATLAMGGLWLLARWSGAFDPDPRATGAPPELADRAMASLVLAVGLTLGLLGLALQRRTWARGLMRGLLVTTLLTSGALTLLTLPAVGGQNAACAYGPLAEVSGLSHAEPPEPIALDQGDERWLPLLLLSACSDQPVTLERVQALNTRGDGATVLGYGLMPPGQQLPNDGLNALPGDAVSVAGRPNADPGQPRQLVVGLRATGDGSFSLDSVRVTYLAGDDRSMYGFATFLSVCAPASCPQ